MAWLRSALLLVLMAVTVVPWALAMLLWSVVRRGEALYWPTVGWLRIAMWGARVICGVRPEVTGLAHLPRAGTREAVLLAPKHQSTWETFFFPTLMPHPLAYVFKRELLMIPFFGWAMGRLDMIHIDRSRRTEAWSKVAEQGRRLFGQGVWVIMFPRARARRAATRGPTRPARRGWPSPPGCRSCRSRWLPRAAGRAAVSC